MNSAYQPGQPASCRPVRWAFPLAAKEAAIDASTPATPVPCGSLLAPVYQPVSTVLSPKQLISGRPPAMIAIKFG